MISNQSSQSNDLDFNVLKLKGKTKTNLALENIRIKTLTFHLSVELPNPFLGMGSTFHYIQLKSWRIKGKPGSILQSLC